MAGRILRNRHVMEMLGWTAHQPVGWRAILGAVLCVAVPAAAGRRSLTGIFVSALFMALAPPIATLCTRWSWGDAAAIALVAMLAAISGYNRRFAMATMRFIIFLVMSMSIAGQPGGNPGGVALLLSLGAIWGAIIRAGLRPAKAPTPEPATMAAQKLTRRQGIIRLKRVLRTAEGWQYPIRLALALGLSSILRHLWPDQHFSWVLVTAVLLVERQPEALPVKTTQRALGVVVGVALTGLVLAELRSSIAIAALVCLLATLRPWLRARNYLAYSAAMTPLVLLVMDLGKPIGGTVLIDRLIATLLGAVIVIAVNLFAVRFISPKPAAGET